jgi:hypothetical protein
MCWIMYFKRLPHSFLRQFYFYFRFNGQEGTHVKVTDFFREKDCLVCGPGTLIDIEPSVTLAEVKGVCSIIYFKKTFNLAPCKIWVIL